MTNDRSPTTVAIAQITASSTIPAGKVTKLISN